MDSKLWGMRVPHNFNDNTKPKSRVKNNNNYFNFNQIAPCPPSSRPIHKTPRLCHTRNRRYDENRHQSNALHLDAGGVEALQETAKLALTSFTNHLMMRFHTNYGKVQPTKDTNNKSPTKEQLQQSTHSIPITPTMTSYNTSTKSNNPLSVPITPFPFSNSSTTNPLPSAHKFPSSKSTSTCPTTSSFILPGDPRWVDRHNLPNNNDLTKTSGSERSATPSSVWTATHSARRKIMEARLNDIQERLQTLESNYQNGMSSSWFNNNAFSPTSYLHAPSDNGSRRTTEASLIFDFQDQSPTPDNNRNEDVPDLICTNSGHQNPSFDITHPKPEPQDIFEGVHHPNSGFKPPPTRAPVNFKPITTQSPTPSPPPIVQQLTPLPIVTNIIEEPNPTTSTVTSPCSEPPHDPFTDETNTSHTTIKLGGASCKVGSVHTSSSKSLETSGVSNKEPNIVTQSKIPLPDPRRPSTANNVSFPSRNSTIVLDDKLYILKVVVLQISGPIPRSESTHVRLLLFDEVHRTDDDDCEGPFPFWNQEFIFNLPKTVHRNANLRIEIVDDEEILGKCFLDSSSLQTTTTELKLPIIWEPDIQCGECYIHLMATFMVNESSSKTYDKRNSTTLPEKPNENNTHKLSTDNIWKLIPSYRLGHSLSVTEISDQST